MPVALRDSLKSTLEELERDGILAPRDRADTMGELIPKKDGRLRLCLDPKDLNKAILREHYPLPTIEEVATRLYGAKCFTIQNARHGFWHIPLDEASSMLTTFNSLFGRYRWKWLPFGISSAPEVFQRKMHEVIEGLRGIEVVANDFIVVGDGDTEEQAIEDHDTNLEAFLKHCTEHNLWLNLAKMCLWIPEVPLLDMLPLLMASKSIPTKSRQYWTCHHLGMWQEYDEYWGLCSTSANSCRISLT